MHEMGRVRRIKLKLNFELILATLCSQNLHLCEKLLLESYVFNSLD